MVCKGPKRGRPLKVTNIEDSKSQVEGAQLPLACRFAFCAAAYTEEWTSRMCMRYPWTDHTHELHDSMCPSTEPILVKTGVNGLWVAGADDEVSKS